MNGRLKIASLTTVALTGFAANSILCRLALGRKLLDPATFTMIRIAAGAATLMLIRSAVRAPSGGGRWSSAVALAGYAVAFSLAYVRLTTGSGALILFGCVQATMIGWSIARGRRPSAPEWTGLALASAGLVALTYPGLSAPDPTAAALMASAGVAWGIYTLQGRGSSNPLAETAGNFLRAVPLALLACPLALMHPAVSTSGVLLATASGSLASGVGYTLWYAALPALGANRAAILQLGVPALAAAGGVLLLGEALSLRLCLAGLAILGGIALTLRRS